ncbi:MAG: bifunctional heptose 7-phosphate kinase/heptose 1-phosphate adenyltransferase [Chthoniobacterales bacterium]
MLKQSDIGDGVNLVMNLKRLQHILEVARTKRILVIGDVMLDRFIYGRVSRISPEAPVPVVEVTSETNYPGGAANVARNLIPFSSHVAICGLIGSDTPGGELNTMLEHCGMDTSCLLAREKKSTIVKTRVIARQQQVVRVDRETLSSPDRSDIEDIVASIKNASDKQSFDGVIFEDYAKGFLTQELVNAIRKTLPESCIVTVDPNPTNKLSWKGVTAIKPNRKEAFADLNQIDRTPDKPALEDEHLLKVGQDFLTKSESKTLLLTLGEQGMLLFQDGQAPYHTPTRAKEVFDVSGAGDTAIALFTIALCSDATGIEAAEIANLASGIAVGKLGTATVTADDLRGLY